MSGETLRRAADFVEGLIEEIYPRDVFIPPTAQMLDEVNALLHETRGHRLDGIAAECMRRGLAVAAYRLRDLADDEESA